MNSSDKAKELFKKYYNLTDASLSMKDAHKIAIQCTIIVCDEILQTKNYPNTLHPEMTAFSNAYWIGVKKNLLNL
jgi:hypothetical protein